MAEADASGSVVKTYGYQPGSEWSGVEWSTNPLFMKQAEEYYFYQNDHLGTPILMTNAAGANVWSAYYDAFGKVTVNPSSVVTNNLRFPGQYYDSESDLHYNFHRYYNPKIGRYLRHDPIGSDVGNENVYVYASSNPINYYDPTGEWLRVVGAIYWTGYVYCLYDCIEENIRRVNRTLDPASPEYNIICFPEENVNCHEFCMNPWNWPFFR